MSIEAGKQKETIIITTGHDAGEPSIVYVEGSRVHKLVGEEAMNILNLVKTALVEAQPESRLHIVQRTDESQPTQASSQPSLWLENGRNAI